MDQLRITVVDGFCGGGLYQGVQDQRYGSPLVLLNAVRAAAIRLNQHRQKPLVVEAEFIFSDAKREHVEYLREVIKSSDHAEGLGKNIHLKVGEFDELLPAMIHSIQKRQRAGRSLFILDQFGWSTVSMQSIQLIFDALQRAEVLLTFSIDALLNYLRSDGDISEKIAQFGVDGTFLKRWHDWKNDGSAGRSVAQRSLMANIHQNSHAKFFTPFMLFSSADNRWMMLAHLAQSQAARDKMLTVHWELQNSFKHIGKGSLYELGFDHRIIESDTALFNFSVEDQSRMKTDLRRELPAKVMGLLKSDRIEVAALLEAIGNHTAATNGDIFDLLAGLSDAKELQVLKPDGSAKRWGSAVTARDTLIRPAQYTFKLG